MKTTYRAMLAIGTLLLSFLANAQATYNESNKHTFTTDYGTIEIGPFDTSHGHIYTDRSNIPSAKELEANSIQLGEMNMKLLEKIEELTLYIIAQNKKKCDLENQNEQLQLLKTEIELIKQKLEDYERN